ncbi:nitrite reductase [Salmonella enterica subsp. enterica serovar Lerum]|nr:nitrite reductase [Salmonella enterica subsp. enterica serovar Lerum]ECA5089335.1 nitrite reductase [Salmonella enterica subsp. enterica serovar Menston]ECB3806788.1 nitrite reductase [Salmonella enterica subsp. enterica serovar Fufu]
MGKIKYGLATLLAIGFWMDATSATVLELPAWERNYTGTIAGKPVNVNITRFGNTLYGYYCYEPCNQHKAAIALRGSLQDKEVHLEERVKALSGYWNAEISSSEIKGEWTSADKKRHFPVALIYLKPKNSPDIVLVTNTNDAGGYDPSKEIDCGNTPAISAIKLYRDGKLIQTLDTASVGTCSSFMPQWGDVNFDGYPDLSIVTELLAGPDAPVQTWLYDPAKQRYVDAPASYQEITSPEIDAEHKQIVSYWRGGCCSHGVNVYRWKGKTIELIDRGESYFQPVISKGKMYNCYMIPSYADGRIIYPLVRKNGHLTPPFSLDGTCQSFWLTGNVRTVIQAEKPGAEPESLEIQWQENKASPGRFCPLVPFVEGDKLSPRLVTDDDVPDTCISRAEYEDIKQ